ncbi:transposase [Streptomyces sp. NPDC101225]|uniref:IS701 family transposase n=1 Tax=Streptomyces sp. NPDC101225 TaxID=3366135 RepID=UPI003826F12F
MGLCQVAVHLAAVTPTMRVITDRALRLPADWAADDERREAVGVPDEIAFASKPHQAVRMVADALKAGVSARWFAADEVYCGRELRAQIRQLGLGYTVGVPATHPVTDGAGHRWHARQMLNKVRPGHWMRRSTGDGAKGRREYNWNWLDIRADDTPDGAQQPDGMSVLVARRHRYTGETSYFRCWTPGDVALGALVEIICRRWKIEEADVSQQLADHLDRGAAPQQPGGVGVAIPMGVIAEPASYVEPRGLERCVMWTNAGPRSCSSRPGACRGR